MNKKYPRNMVGYGKNVPKVIWPNQAKIAVQIVLNYEEGSESNILHGDKSNNSDFKHMTFISFCSTMSISV